MLLTTLVSPEKFCIRETEAVIKNLSAWHGDVTGMPVILALGRLKPDCCEFEASQQCIMKPCLKNTEKKREKENKQTKPPNLPPKTFESKAH